MRSRVNQGKAASPRLNYSALIDDDDEDDFILRKLSIKRGHQNVTLTTMGNGLAAVKKLTEGLHPNLILADAPMPLMSGDELLIWLMESPAYRHIPSSSGRVRWPAAR